MGFCRNTALIVFYNRFAMPFKKGKSGNPAGRPRGSQNKASLLRLKFETGGDAVVSKVLNLAKKGDLRAAKLVLERVCPPLRPMDAPMAVFAAAEAKGKKLAELSEGIMRETLEGRISPDMARILVTGLEAASRTRQADDLEARLEELEKRIP